MKNTRPLIILGSISIDRIMNFGGRYQDLIQKDKLHVLSLSVLIDKLEDSRGGTAANIAYNLGLLNCNSTILSSVGPNTEKYLNDLSKLGVDISKVHISNLQTSTFTVLTDQDNNQVGGFYPGAMSDNSTLTLEPWYDQNPLVLVGAFDPSCMRRLVQECKDHNLELIYDIGQQVSNVPVEDLVSGVNTANILILNDYELGVLTQRTALSEQEIKTRVPIVVTTLGKDGSRIEGKKIPSPITISSVKNLIPLDPTGAGDAYRAGFISGYLKNQDLKVCAQLGSVCASYTVEKVGTQTHTFSIEDFNQRYLDTYKEEYEKSI